MACGCQGTGCSTCQTALQTALDEARGCISALGTGSYSTEVKVVTRTWDGGKIGLGSIDATVVTLSPRPKVEPADGPRYVGTDGGKVAEGDRAVSGVSMSYEKADLTDTGLAAATERFYLLNGEPYRLATEPVCTGTSWRFRLSRMRGRPELTDITPVLAVNTEPPQILGTPGATLTANVGTWTGSNPKTYEYAWESSVAGITWTVVGTSATYDDSVIEGFRRLGIRATNTAGPSDWVYSQPLPKVDGLPVVPPSLDGVPTISGTPNVGYTLTATAAPLAFGTEPIGTTWQWYADAVAISGATSITYDLTATEQGAVITVEQTATGDGVATATSAPTAAVGAAVAPSIVVYPTVDTERGDGITVGVTVGEWAGSAITGYAYQWQLWVAGAWVSVAGAPGTASTWTDTATTVLQHLRCLVSATNAAGTVQAAGIPAFNPQANDSEWFVDLSELTPIYVSDTGNAGGVFGGSQPAHPMTPGTVVPGTDSRNVGEGACWVFDVTGHANRFNGAAVLATPVDSRVPFRIEFGIVPTPEDGVSTALGFGLDAGGATPFVVGTSVFCAGGLENVSVSALPRNRAFVARGSSVVTIGTQLLKSTTLLQHGVALFTHSNDALFVGMSPFCLMRENPLGSLPFDSAKDSFARQDGKNSAITFGARVLFVVCVWRSTTVTVPHAVSIDYARIFLGRNLV